MKYLTEVCGRFFYILLNFHRKFAILVMPPTNVTMIRLVHYKAHLVVQQMREISPNWSIIGNAIVPQSATKLTKMCGSEFGSLLWCHVMPQRKTTIRVHNYSPSCAQQLQRYFGKFASCMSFGAHILVWSEPFLDNPCELWQLLPALYSDMQKKNYGYIGVHLHSQPWSTAVEFYSNFLLPIGSEMHKLFRRFLEFSQFSTAILRKMWRHLPTKMVILKSIWKGTPFWKNGENCTKIGL